MASEAEIFTQLQRLVENMTAPHGVDFDKAYPEYVRALAKFAIAEITETVDRVLAAEFGNRGTKAYPRVAEFSEYVRQVVDEQTEAVDKVRRKHQFETERHEAAQIEEVFRDRTDEERARVAAKYHEFVASLATDNAAARRERDRQRAEIRARYGMTDEALATVPDRKLPNAMAPVADIQLSHQPFRRENRQADDEELPW